MKYRFKTRPYAHQRKAIKFLLSQIRQELPGGALLMEPRTGKTKVCIDFASIMAQAGKVKKVLVICPARVIGVWTREIHAHCPVMFEIVIWDVDGRKSRLQQPQPSSDLQFVIMNYEAFGTPGRITKRDHKGNIVKRSRSTGGRFTVKKHLRQWVGTDPALLIADESHKIKSPSGRVALGVVSMQSSFRYRVLATGTPVTKAKRVFDVYMQWKLLNPDRFEHVPTLSEFKEHYGRWAKAPWPKFLGAKNLDELRKLVHADSFAVSRDECFDLPVPKRQVELVPLDGKTARLYDEMAEDMVAELSNGQVVEASIPLVRTLRLLQITSGIAATPERRLYRVGRHKLNALQPYLDEAKERDEKIVIMARFRADIAAIEKLARERFNLPVFKLWGGLKRGDVDRDLLMFQRMDDAAVYVIQPNSGSLGIDLSTAGRMVWYSLTPSWVDYSQATDRNALHPRQTQIVYLLAENTVDEELFVTLEEDGNIARLVATHPEKLLRSTPGAISSRYGVPRPDQGKVVYL